MSELADRESPSPPVAPATEPVCGINLESYAAISARLSAGQPREPLLASHQLTEADWLNVERTWALRLVAHAQRGEHEMLFAFEHAYADALEAATPSEPPRPLAVYARVVASIEAGLSVAVICAEEGLSLAEFGQLQRAWTKRLAADSTLNEELVEMVRGMRR